jgi:Domain of unknown function DUF29
MKRTATGQEEQTSLYDSDFALWAETTAENVRKGCLPEAEREHVAEEIADMAKRDYRELRSRLIVLLMHLMKWAAQPERRNGSTWLYTIDEQRDQIRIIFEESPSLRARLSKEMLTVYERAAKGASGETATNRMNFLVSGLHPGNLLGFDILLDDSFFPERIEDLYPKPGKA